MAWWGFAVNDADFRILTLRPPRIIIAKVLPMYGNEIKPRPLVLLTTPTENHPDCEFEVIAGSRDAPSAMHDPFTIKARGNKKPGGHLATGLTADTYFSAERVASSACRSMFPPSRLPRWKWRTALGRAFGCWQYEQNVEEVRQVARPRGWYLPRMTPVGMDVPDRRFY